MNVMNVVMMMTTVTTMMIIPLRRMALDGSQDTYYREEHVPIRHFSVK